MAPAQGSGIDGFHLIQGFFCLIETVPVIGPEEIRRRVETRCISAEKSLFFFQISTEAAGAWPGASINLIVAPFPRSRIEPSSRAISSGNEAEGVSVGASDINPSSINVRVIVLSESKIFPIIRSFKKIARFKTEETIFIQGYLFFKRGKTIIWSKWEWRITR